MKDIEDDDNCKDVYDNYDDKESKKDEELGE